MKERGNREEEKEEEEVEEEEAERCTFAIGVTN